MLSRFSVVLASLVMFCLGGFAHAGDSSAAWPAEKRLRGTNVTIDITEDDIKHLSENWKANVIRLLHMGVLSDKAPYKPKRSQLARIFETIDLGLKYNMAVVFAPGIMDPEGKISLDDFFGNAEFRKAYISFWKDVAKRYADNPGVVVYDLMNEPHGEVAKTEWSGYAKELTAAIREVDKTHTIMVEPQEWGWAHGFPLLEPTGDANTVYSFHFYGPMDFTHQRRVTTDEEWAKLVYPGFIQGEQWNRSLIEIYLAPAFEFRDQHNVKIWCGEFGAIRWGKGAKQWYTDVIKTLEIEEVGWAYYSFREWRAMDIEMDPNARNLPTERSETELVKLFKEYFGKNE